MKKMNKKLIIAVLLILLFVIGIGINKLGADVNVHEEKEFSVNSLMDREKNNGDGASVFCIAHNYKLTTNPCVFTRDHLITINGIEAITDKEKTNKHKSNAILAYICYQARNEASMNTWEDHDQSNSQNAMWDYWDTWYKKNNINLEIKDIYDIKSSPENANKADRLLKQAESYYNVLTGETGVKAVTNESSKKVDNNTSFDYYGPFKVQRKNDTYVIEEEGKGITIETDNNIIGFVSNVGDSRANSKTFMKFGDKFYIMVKQGYITDSFAVKYKVVQYGAKLGLWSYTYDNVRYQNVLRATTWKEEKELSLTLKLEDNPGYVSLQKFIVESGNNYNIDVSGNCSISGGNGYNTSRMNKKAKEESDTAISNVKIDSVDYTTAGYFPGNKTKSDNIYMIKQGDVVVYKIDVYNNGSKDTEVEVKDRIDSNATLVGIYDSYDSNYSYYYDPLSKGNAESRTTYVDYTNTVTNPNGKYYKWKANPNAGNKDSFWVIIRYNTYTTRTINNKAYITGNKASDSYQTEDYDYVKMERYSVNLEKFVSKVTDKNGGNTETYNNRYGKRYNEFLKDEDNNANKNEYKINNKVPVEVGDKVTFTIRLKNTGNMPVKITQIYDSFRDENKGLASEWKKLTYDTSYGIKGNGGGTVYNKYYGDDVKENGENYSHLNRYLIQFNNATLLNPGDYTDVTIRYTVEVSDTLTISPNLGLQNKAGIVQFKNKAGEIVETDSDGTDNNYDMDWVKLKPYYVKLEKIVSRVKTKSNSNTDISRFTNRYEKDGHYGPEYGNHNGTTTDYRKYNNPVEVENGDTVTYAIKVTNEGDTQVAISTIKDTLPNGVEYNTRVGTIKGTAYTESGDKKGDLTFDVDNQMQITITNKILLNKNEYIIIYIPVEVTEPNISTEVLKNTAEVTKISNRNEGVVLKDSCQGDNKDSDYIQMKDITIAGTVWNDKALNKTKDNYNGQYDEGQENKLSGIKVQLYRNGKGVIAETTTDGNGNYKFDASMIKPDVVTHQCERYIKAAYECVGDHSGLHGANYWNKRYYSYYIKFEYDGVTYTSTVFADVTSPNELDSNAQENLSERTEFNSGFNTNEISYKTKNEEGYIPQSNYNAYNSKEELLDLYKMQSSTNLISLSNTEALEQQLQHVNLGLRGRDVFDLELTSDVYSTKVTVNRQEGEYSYNNNKVTVRKSDILVAEDAANFGSEAKEVTVSEVDQKIRNTDIKNDAYDVNNDGTKGDTGLGIEVTYKITVTNASTSPGTVTKIIDYYDNKYTFVKAYDGNGNEMTINNKKVTEGDSGTGYKSVIITTKAVTMNASGSSDFYIVYTLNDPATTLKGLLDGTTDKIPTYNMAEIYEYKTVTGPSEFTRGLIDKDSAPGSANREQVRTTDTLNQNTATTNGNPTTVEYYFAGNNDLTKLKYEDDTYATPTLYFVSSDNQRTITGTVFEDYTNINSNFVKSGNGIKDTTEPIIKGVKVDLLENGVVRYTTRSNEEGKYEFKGFLPGNYTIKYYYGDTENTFLVKEPNEESYNGEDFQATNNSYDVEGITTNKLSSRENYWYLDNEEKGISIAKDDTQRRNTVSSNVIEFTDEQMVKLNNARDGVQLTDIGSMEDENTLIGKTYMYAHTNSMLFKVEKSEVKDNEVEQVAEFKDYVINNMNFGIAEVPVTTIDLQKAVQAFTLTDSTGQKVIASANKNSEGKWIDNVGVKVDDGMSIIPIEVEDEKLQGARLQVTYAITSNMTTEKNFDNKSLTVPTIKGIVDYIDNNLSYNASLGDNDKYWEVTTYDEIKASYEAMQYKDGTKPQGTVDAEGTKHTTIVKAKADNPILLTEAGTGTATITLEKILSSTDSTIEEIITSTVDTYEYNNIVEITGIDKNVTPEGENSDPQRDRIRTKGRYIILPGVQHDSKSAETISIYPPLGDSSIHTMYYVIAAISLVVLAVGAFGIKKFVVKK